MIISARFLEVTDHLQLVIQVLKVKVGVKQRMILLPIDVEILNHAEVSTNLRVLENFEGNDIPHLVSINLEGVGEADFLKPFLGTRHGLTGCDGIVEGIQR